MGILTGIPVANFSTQQVDSCLDGDRQGIRWHKHRPLLLGCLQDDDPDHSASFASQSAIRISSEEDLHNDPNGYMSVKMYLNARPLCLPLGHGCLCYP